MKLIHNDKKHLSIEFHGPHFVWTKDAFNEFSDEVSRVWLIQFDTLAAFNQEKNLRGEVEFWQFRLILLGFGFSVFNEKFE